MNLKILTTDQLISLSVSLEMFLSSVSKAGNVSVSINKILELPQPVTASKQVYDQLKELDELLRAEPKPAASPAAILTQQKLVHELLIRQRVLALQTV